MKWLLTALSLALLLSLVAAVGVASATPTSSDNPPRDFVNGSGHVFGQDLALSATSGPSGENVQGHYRIDFNNGTAVHQGPVTCLATQGNTAIAGGPRPDFPQFGHFIFVEDNGNSSEAVPDRVQEITGPPPTPFGCQQALEAVTQTFAIDRGNFTVHDAPAAEVTP